MIPQLGNSKFLHLWTFCGNILTYFILSYVFIFVLANIPQANSAVQIKDPVVVVPLIF